MRVVEQVAKRMLVKELVPHPRNPNRGDTEAIRESIEHTGFFGRIIVQKGTNYILAGNHRYEAAKALGAKSVPVWVVDVDEMAALKILLVDNRAASLSERDDEKLLAALAFLAEGEEGLEGTGYGQDEIERLLGKIPGVQDIEDAWPSAIRQIVVVCDVTQFDEMMTTFEDVMRNAGAETNTEVLERLLTGVGL